VATCSSCGKENPEGSPSAAGAQAQLAEHAGNHEGRCLVALEDPAAEQPLRQATELFSSMGYRPALAQTEALLEQTTAPA
jgi:hypothetical protein